MTYHHPTPFDTEFEPLWLPEMFRRTTVRVPDALFMDFMGREYSYRESWSLIRRVASGLKAMGVGPGVSVGLFLPNCPQYPIAAYATWLTGARLVNFSPLYTADELLAQVENSETDIMVTLDAAALLPTIQKVFDKSRLQKLVIGSVADVLPPAKALLYRLFKRKERSGWTANEQHINFNSLLSHPEMELPEEMPSADEVALLQYTGGTTGRPKGAMLTHANLSINAQQVEALDDQPDAPDRVIAALPLFHVFAQTAILNRAVARGGLIILLPKFEVKAVLDAIERCQATGFPGVPTMYQALLNHPFLERRDLSTLRICVSGGAPLPDPMRKAFDKATGARLIEGYGLTESSGVVCCNPFSGGVPGTIGQPLPGTNIRLLDKDDPTKLAKPGDSGELAFSGPQMMAGYWKHDNDDIFIDGYCRTGDVATVDDDGYYRIIDRIKDMIIVGGFKVFPSTLEQILYTHPAVEDAIVIGVPDAYSGEKPKAFVILKKDAKATVEELLAYLNSRAGKHERTVALEIRKDLPRTLIGKLSRKELVEEEKQKAGA